MGDKASLVVRLSDLKKRVSELLEEDLKLKEEEFAKAEEIKMSQRVSAGRRFLNKEEKFWFDAKMKEESKVIKRGERLYQTAFEYVYDVQSIEESRLLFRHILPNLRPLLHERQRERWRILPDGIPLILPKQREEEESSKGRSQIIVPLLPYGLEGNLLNLDKALSKLEEQFSVLEAKIQFPRQYHNRWASLSLYRKAEVLHHAISKQGFTAPPESPKEMDLLRKRMELLWSEALSHKLRMKSQRQHFLVTLILTRFESHLQERAAMIRDCHMKLSEIEIKLTGYQPNNAGSIWKLTSFPLEQYEFRDRLNYVAMEELEDLLQSTVAEYPEDIEEGASEVDIVSYLSSSGGELVRNNGDRVSLDQDTFKGKHVWVCCFHVPFLSPWKSFDFHPLINLCSELYSTRDDFEMIMVARMNILANEGEVFRHFFSGFPESCLAVPFENKQRRDSICKLVGLDLRHERHGRLESVLLNPERQVLPIRKYLGRYGAEAFPFTEALLDREYEECRNIVFGKVGLERVLRCNASSPDIVYKLNPSGSREEKVPISELDGRHVWLYLCASGNNIGTVRKMHDKCREAQQEFEIVVVNMPFEACTDPKIHESMIDSLLEKHNASGWWRLPFNNSVSCRFLRLTGIYDTGVLGYGGHDKVMVVGPQVEHLDMYGVHVMCRQGIDAYPFTVDAGIKMSKKQLQGITLESLFLDGVLFSRGDDGADTKELAQLLNGGKKIMVCIDRLDGDYDWDEQFETLASVYDEVKEMSQDFELVFVEDVSREKVTSESVGDAEREEIVSNMPWYVCPRIKINSGNVRKLARFFHDGGRCDALVGFGEDVRICSYRYKEMLNWSVPYWRKFDFTSLDGDIEHMLGYDEYNDHGMTRFMNPRRIMKR